MSRLRIGLVGFGKIARTQHLPAIAAAADMELVALADPIAVHEQLPVYPDLASMLALQPEVDAVVLCQPPAFRYAAACQAIEAGRHVMLEKPPAVTLEQAADLIDRARRHGVALHAAWHSRHAAAVTRAREWLAGKTVSSVRIDWMEDVRHWHPGQAWIWNAGGFGVFDPGINALSILTSILPGEVTLVDSVLEVPVNRAMPIAAHLRMRNEAGYPIEAQFDWRQTGPQTWDIRCETDCGVLTLFEGGNRLKIDGDEQVVDSEREYAGIYSHFAEIVARGAIDFDTAPLHIVVDAFTKGRVVSAAPFED